MELTPRGKIIMLLIEFGMPWDDALIAHPLNRRKRSKADYGSIRDVTLYLFKCGSNDSTSFRFGWNGSNYVLLGRVEPNGEIIPIEIRDQQSLILFNFLSAVKVVLDQEIKVRGDYRQ